MTIEEVKEKKQQLKKDIVVLLNTFTKETGLDVTSISIEDVVRRFGYDEVEGYFVDVEVVV